MTDWKPERRIKDPEAIRRKRRQERACRCGCGRPVSDAHHVLPKSLGGDDVEDNIVGMYHDCHMALEHDASDWAAVVRSKVGVNLRWEEIAYVVRKRGFEQGIDFLKRYYDRKPTHDERNELIRMMRIIRMEGESY